MNVRIAWIRSVKQLFSGGGPRQSARLPDVLLILFLWFTLVILSGLGSVTRLSLGDLSVFVAVGMIGLTAAGIVTVLLAWCRKELSLVVFLSYVMLVMLPAFAIVLRSSNRIILLDLYFVLLVTTPAFLSLWSWRFQALAGALAVLAVGMMWVPVGNWVAAHSMVLVAVAALLSGLVVLLRSRDTVQETRELERKGIELFLRSTRDRLPGYVWNVLLLEAGLIVILGFLDLALWGDLAFQLILIKVYALIVLVFGGLLIMVTRTQRSPWVLALVTVVVGLILSIARTEYTDLQLFVAALPIFYLALLVSVLPWNLELQISVVWGLVFNDFLVKWIIGAERWTGSSLETFGYVLDHFQGELGVLAVGSAGAVLIARSLRYYRIRNLAHFVELPEGSMTQPGAEEFVPGTEVGAEELELSARSAIEPERREHLIVGMFVTGILSCIVCSRLLLMLGPFFWNLAVTSWIGFFVLWAVLVYVDRNKSAYDYFWVVGAVTKLALFLWPCILLFVAPEPGYLWLYWPFALLLGVGMVPWGARELIALMLVAVVVGVEMIHQLGLGSLGVIVFSVSAIFSLLVSVQNSRRLKEKYFLLNLHRQLSDAANEKNVLRVLADHLMSLFDVGSALVSGHLTHLELIRSQKVFALAPDRWPLRTLSDGLRDQESESAQITVGTRNWLPGTLSFFDKRFGLFHATNGLLFKLDLAKPVAQFDNTEVKLEAAEKEVEEDSFLVFLGFRFPFFEMTRRKEVQVARAMAGIARLRLEYCAEQRRRWSTAKGYESKLQDREQDLGALVHDINNTVQDLTLLCDTIREDILGNEAEMGVLSEEEREQELRMQIKRISVIARSVATVVSDAKRRRELEKMADLAPRELVEVTSVIREIVSFAVIRAARKRIFVEQPKLPGEEIWVRVSVREHLETILRNLLNNAITYSDPGTTVRVELRYDLEWVWIDVIDNGPGLTKEERQSIFESGFRGRFARGIPGGLGLGLAESRRVAEAADGRLEVFSAGEGKGSTFTVSLPRIQRSERSEEDKSPWALVVDDQPALTELYCRLARALQLTPEPASSVSEALEAVKRRGQPSLVVTDIHLGERSGLELVRQLRGEFGKSLPILVVSGLNDEDIAHQARSAGATDFVAKPVGRRALFARIQSLLPDF